MNFLKRWPRWLVVFVVILLAIRAILPYALEYAINHNLSRSLKTYSAHVNDIDLSFWRGAYQVQGLTIKKKNSQLPPLLAIREIDLSIAWRALLKKRVTADIHFDQMQLNLVDSREEKKKQYGTEDKNWQDTLNLLLPVKIESLMIRDSILRFSNFDFKKPIHIEVTDIDMNVSGLKNRSDDPSRYEASGKFQNQAELNLAGRLDISSKPIRGDMDVELKNFDFKSLNNFLRAYVPLDITRGKLSIYSEVATAKGAANGYVKIFIENLDVIKNDQDYISAEHFGYEWLSAFANWLLKNNESENLAAFVPFSWQRKEMKVNSSEAVWSTIENMWDKIPKGFDDSMNLRKFEEGVRITEAPN